MSSTTHSPSRDADCNGSNDVRQWVSVCGFTPATSSNPPAQRIFHFDVAVEVAAPEQIDLRAMQ